MENGYREFSTVDMKKLQHIVVLRRLGLNIPEIKQVLSKPKTMKKLALQRQLNIQRDKEKYELLSKLSSGASLYDVEKALDSLEKNMQICERILSSFPGYYGKFLYLHFSRFLKFPISSKEQLQAYKTVIDFFDSLASIKFPAKLKDFFESNADLIDDMDIDKLLENTKNAYENPQEFLENNKETLEKYISFRTSEEYKDSEFGKIQELLQKFMQSSEYTTVFIPAMKQLSPAYSEYYKSIENAQEALFKKYPETMNLNK